VVLIGEGLGHVLFLGLGCCLLHQFGICILHLENYNASSEGLIFLNIGQAKRKTTVLISSIKELISMFKFYNKDG
jgi:hypothetical protein